MSGYRPAIIKAKAVIASAPRVIGRRQSAFNNRSTAEIIVPAWLMPTQKTKVVMKRVQYTGRFLPVVPMPHVTRYPQAYSPQATIAPKRPTSAQKRGPVRSMGWSTAWLISASVRLASSTRSSNSRGRSAGASDIRFASLEVDYGRTGAQVFQETEGAVAARQLADAAVWVIEVAEEQGGGGTGLDAGRLDLAIGQGQAGCRGIQLGPTDALDAEGAFLDDAARTHADVRVQLLGQGLGELGSEPIEGANLVGAGVAAIACPNAAVVDLRVQSLRAVVGGEHRAHRLAGRLRALLAHHRHEAGLDVGVFTFPVPLNDDPVHPAAVAGLFFTDDGDIVLGVASDHARLAASAPVKVNDHGPTARGAGCGAFSGGFRDLCHPDSPAWPISWSGGRPPPGHASHPRLRQRLPARPRGR